MAENKHISELPAASSIGDSDLFVVEQSSTAKKVSGSVIKNYTTLDILSVTVTTLSPGTSATASYNATTKVLSLGIPQGATGSTGPTGPTGTSITSITKTGTVGLVDTYTISFSNSTSTTFTVTNGAKGDTGTRASILDTKYGTSSSYSVQPTVWTSSIPEVYAGNFLWTKLSWNTGTETIFCTKYGDGSVVLSNIVEVTPTQSEGETIFNMWLGGISPVLVYGTMVYQLTSTAPIGTIYPPEDVALEFVSGIAVYDSATDKYRHGRIQVYHHDSTGITDTPTISYIDIVNDHTHAPSDIEGVSYTTSTPTSANTDGIKIAVLNSEPATKYNGWLYLITE